MAVAVIGIALGELLAAPRFGWQCSMLIRLRRPGAIASVLGGCGASPGPRGFREKTVLDSLLDAKLLLAVGPVLWQLRFPRIPSE